MSTKPTDFEEDLKEKQKRMEQELEEGRLKKKNVIKVDSEDLNLIIQEYKDKYSQDNKYQEGFDEPEVKDGSLYLTFSSEEEAGKFLKKLAKENMAFIVSDPATNKVQAYSTGDGNLYNPDGSLYKGGKFQESDVNYYDFEPPGRKSNLTQ